MKLLFVDACPRARSRTARLCQAYLEQFSALRPEVEVARLWLPGEGLLPLTEKDIERRDALIAHQQWDDPSLRWAVQLQSADHVLIGAPCWDMSFPSVLKCWVEHVCVRNLTFCYREGGRLEGLCHARSAAYLSTVGGFLANIDHGAGYLAAVLGMLGIGPVASASAQGLDVEGMDAEMLLAAACDEARALARAAAEKV